ncbi:MAG: hypothetical protein IJW46_01425, partial [Clostridia bacterium]|nr:hypothetical protein [Clostridia bacterium]
MNEHNTHRLKNFIIMMTGIIISLAGIVYIVVQYSKLLTALIMKNEDAEDEGSKCDAKLRSRFRQVQTDEGETSPDTLDEDDLSFEIA